MNVPACLMTAALSFFFAADSEAEMEATTADAAAPSAVRRAYDALLPSLVEVRIDVLDDPEVPQEERTPLDLQFDGFVRQRVPMRLSGVRVTETGTVLIRDPNLPLRRYGAIELADRAGDTVRARLGSVLENHAGILLEPIEPPKTALPHLTFQPAELSTGQPLLVAQPAFLEKSLSVRIEQSYAAATAVQGDDPLAELYWWQDSPLASLFRGYVAMTAPIILDADARVLGVALDNALWVTSESVDSWIGTEIMSDRRLTPVALDEIADAIRARARATVKEIEIQFRSDSPLPQRLTLEEGKLFLYGVLLDSAGRVFIPTELDVNAVRQIEKITVMEGDKQVEAEFLGLFRDFGALLIRAKGISAEDDAGVQHAPLLREGGTLPRGKAFFTLCVRRRYGQRRDNVEYNRYLDMATGYKDSRYPVPLRPLRVGDLVTDAEGRLLGFQAPVRREEQDVIRARLGLYGTPKPPQMRVYLFSEIATLLERPQSHFDAMARPMTRKEERGMVWLGVEYQQMTPALARAFKAEGPTRGGARGLLVTHVYESSPAAKIGIAVGDVLLSLGVPGTPAEIDLTEPAVESRSRRPDQGGFPAWRSRRNSLTAILTLLGEGREIRLRFFQGGEEKEILLTLEKAPDDFLNADEYREPALGLAVREMTYDVRSALRWPADAPGVVVSEVEPGSKAAVAQIVPFEIISRVNDEPVSSPKQFERIVRNAASRGTVELLVIRLGQSRIVEIDFSSGPL